MEPSLEEMFINPVLFKLPSLLKGSVFSEAQKIDWAKDYLSKNKNIEKYVYEACEALQIFGISYIKYKKELDIYSDKELNDGAGEIVGRNFEIEARLTLRRAVELFIESWYFKKTETDKESILRYYFLIRNLKAFHLREYNLKEFCDLSSAFDVKVVSEIRQELNNIDIPTPFYINEKKDYKKDKDIVRLMRTYAQLFKEVVGKMPDGQRSIVGESYQLYAETSEVLHGYSGGLKFNLKNYHQEIDGLYARMAILSANILSNVVTISEKCIGNSELINAIKGIELDSLPEAFLLSVGDNVLVRRAIKAEVTEISVSKYGCKKYKVRYADKRGIWSMAFEQEWFLVKDLIKIPD